MKPIAAVLVLLAAVPLAFAAAPAAFLVKEDPKPAGKPTKPVKVLTYDESAIGADQLAAAFARAKRKDTRVLVQWGANWCGWCNLLASTSKTDKDIARELLYEYEVVKIDVGRFDKHLDLAKKYGAAIDQGIPYLTVLDADGNVLGNHETGSLEDKSTDVQRHDPVKVLALLAKYETPRVEAVKLRDAALARAKAEQKRVFVHFGAPWCGWCHKLEGWMARPEIAAILSKDFVDLEIDQDRRVGGKEMLAALRGPVEGGIPWFAILDADGKVLAKSDGPGGNIGFPAAPEEIAHFRAMLAATVVRITQEEIDALVASLTPPKKEG